MKPSNQVSSDVARSVRFGLGQHVRPQEHRPRTNDEGDRISRRAAVIYVVVTFAVTWGAWLPLVAHALGHRILPAPSWLFVVGVFGPALGGLCATLAAEGPRGTVDWLRRIANGRRRAIQITVVAGACVALMLVGQAIVLPGPSTFGAALGHILPSAGLAVAFAGWLVLAAGEEIGWRGWLLPYVLRRCGAVATSLVIGGIWVVWHVPMFTFREGYPLNAMMFGVVGTLLAASAALTWLTLQARWSIWPAIVWQGGFSLLLSEGSSAPIGASVVVVVAGIAAVVHLSLYGRPGPTSPGRPPKLQSPGRRV